MQPLGQTMNHALLNPNDKSVIIVIIIPSKWTAYCSDPYTRESYGGNAFWTAISPKMKIYNRSFERKLRLHRKRRSLQKLLV